MGTRASLFDRTWSDQPSRLTCEACRHGGLCAPDCTFAPWNMDAKYPATPFVYLLRQRRWAGSPVDYADTRFQDYEIQRQRGVLLDDSTEGTTP